jgi:phage terminase large subunit-like protein
MPQTDDFRSALAGALDDRAWHSTARANQVPPLGTWFCWLMCGGRGAGKTRAGAEWIIDQINGGKRRIALVAPTAADARDTMVEGQSGILACSPDHNRPLYEPSKRRLTWPNGAIATLYSADEPERLRGPQHDAAWCDELGSWRRPEAWSNLMFGLRGGNDPRCVVTTTPRPTRLVKDLVSREGSDVVVSRSTTYENRDHLAPAFLNQIIRKYEGTRLGRQELLAELLTDVPGALWNLDQIEALRVDASPVLQRIVVAIDPSGSGDEGADEVGIIAAAVDENGHGWVLCDASGHYQPTVWAQKAVELYHNLHADRIVAEQNFGGAMIEAVIRAIDPNVSYRSVTASRGKVARAEPVAALYEQGRVHHLGSFPELEDEMASFTSNFDRSRAGFSPGRVDALVWALTDLMALPMAAYAVYEVARAAAEGRPIIPPGLNPLLDVYRAAQARQAAGQSPFVDSRQEWRRRYDEQAATATPSHPDCQGGDVEFVNGPKVRHAPQPGSLEWFNSKVSDR